MPAQLPDFTDTAFLHSHIRSILAFYEPNVLATNGFNQCFKDNGDVYDASTRHLVSSTRFTFNYATAYRLYGTPHYKQWAEHGLKHLVEHHKQDTGHFAWELNDGVVTDGRAMAYGSAFVMLCASSCVEAGVTDALTLIDETWDFVEQHFWDSTHHAYADERDASLENLSDYRGQNANMHMCEALIAAWHTTKQTRYLERATLLANRFCFELAEQSGGLVWEHYDANWQVDMQYNIDKPDDLFKPWGFQPGHQVEWSKLLLQLSDCIGSGFGGGGSDEGPGDCSGDSTTKQMFIEKAKFLFDSALEKGWDKEHDGLVYGFAPNLEFADTHKYFWVHAEAIAASWRLYKVCDESRYLDHYNRLWQYSWTHLIDHRYGAWYRIRNRDGTACDDLKSPPGKTDYHTMGAVWHTLGLI